MIRCGMIHRIFLIVCVTLIGMAFAQDAVDGQTAVAVKDSVAVDQSVTIKDSVTADQPVIVKDSVTADQPVIVKDSVAVDQLVIVKGSAAIEHQPAEQGLDIDRLLAEDDGGDLLPEEELIDIASTDSTVADSTAIPVSAESGEQLVNQDAELDSTDVGDGTAGADGTYQPAVGRGGRRGAPAAAQDYADSGPAVIKDGRTINFAQNLEGYRSPRVAMALSLLVPGLGQAYSRSYTKAGAFGAAELVIIGVSAYFNSKGKSAKAEAHRFADLNFDVGKIEQYDTQLRNEFREREILIDEMSYPPYDTVFFNSAREGARTSYFYESIRGMHFTPGWRDSDPDFGDIFSTKDTMTGRWSGTYIRYNPNYTPEQTNIPDFYFLMRIIDEAGNSVNSGRIISYSNLQSEYSAMVDKANSYHDAANFTLYALILNHIASAIDAGFTARAYNARLLGKESVWERVTIEQQYVFTGSDLSPGLALRVRF